MLFYFFFCQHIKMLHVDSMSEIKDKVNAILPFLSVYKDVTC